MDGREEGEDQDSHNWMEMMMFSTAGFFFKGRAF